MSSGLGGSPRQWTRVAVQLPFPDGTFDAAMTTFGVHQWSDTGAGLREMRGVTRGPVAVPTSCDPGFVQDFWLYEYAPLVLDTEARRHPSVAGIADTLGGGTVTATAVPVPSDCTDGSTRLSIPARSRPAGPGVSWRTGRGRSTSAVSNRLGGRELGRAARSAAGRGGP
ncbi:hypothetical protein AB0I51_17330 [Streptomyces sp. NPDC050549]|uniref:class I SAM-dependent methyltransferase n=1 Tax=Streptomyces sp. NPDC050549 TaxID=3155406 RepID=UPI00341B2DF8